MTRSLPAGKRRRVRRAGVVAVLLVGLLLAGAPPAAAEAAPQPPLRSGAASAADSWVVLPMGQLSAKDNTFWQVLRLRPGSSHWSSVTPPGTADNGGLVAAVSGASVVAGVLPSGYLHFSPLSVSSDGGSTWAPAFLPGALGSVPDGLALGAGPGARALAVVGDRVLVAPAPVSSWSTLVTLSTLRRTSPRCDGSRLQAVAFTPAGTPLVGLQCRRGVGLFDDVAGTWRQTGARLGVAWARAPTSVIRLALTDSVTTALVATVRSGRTKLSALWQSAGGRWTASPLLPIQAPRPIATSVAASGEVAVLATSSHGLVVDEIAPGGRWTALPTPPTGTVALAPSGTAMTAGRDALDAFTVNGTALGVYGCSPSGTAWHRVQSSQVPLAYGSSS